MTARRVDALESSLDPREFAFHVIAEAREYANLEAYARALVDVPVEAAPMSRIGAHAESSVRAGAPRGTRRQTYRGRQHFRERP